jgi:hypothetical protein
MLRLFITLTAVCGFLAGLHVPARAQTAGLRVSVPFHFLIAKQDYPAGEYVFWARRDHMIMLQRAGGPTIGFLLANSIAGNRAGTTGEVVFECRERLCFLSQVWIPGLNEGRQVLVPPKAPTSRRTERTYVALMGKP